MSGRLRGGDLPRSKSAPKLAPLFLALALAIPLVIPSGALASVATVHASPAPRSPPTTGPGGGAAIAYFFTWNGKSVSNATTTSSALDVNLASPIAMQFHWVGPGPQGPPGGVSEVEFQAYLFGFPFITRALTNTPALGSSSGVSNLSWDPGALNYLIAGVYECLASIYAPNGTTTWSEWFYINIQAPFTIGAVLPIILLLLVLFEVYALLTVKPTPPKGGAAPSPPSPPAPSPPAAAPAAPTAEPGAPSPPPGDAAPVGEEK
jgi:hypothetical protein